MSEQDQSRVDVQPDATVALPQQPPVVRQTGATKLDHVEWMMGEIESRLAHAFGTIRGSTRRMRQIEREQLSRRLAGAIGHCESIRIWLGAGAPR